jgi:intracellular sulfur oxidation DsrE/DsrF family protein
LKNVDYTTLYDVKKEDLVASSVSEIIFLQKQGFSYIKI